MLYVYMYIYTFIFQTMYKGCINNIHTYIGNNVTGIIYNYGYYYDNSKM